MSSSRFGLWVLSAALLLAPSGAAQFNLVNWTEDSDGTSGFFGLTAETMFVSANFATAAGTVIGYETVTPVAGRVKVDIDYFMTTDGVCGVSVPVFVVDGAPSVLANCSTFDAHYEFLVAAGSEYGLGIQTTGTTWPGTVVFANFDFEPLVGGATWTDLPGGLPGAAGTPTLTGTSLMYPHFPFTLDVAGAAPSAPAALIVGFSAINAPFKGGVLVPDVDLVLVGLGTTATGTLQLATFWPFWLPAGTALYFQAWIADAGGPVGFAATQGLKATTP